MKKLVYLTVILLASALAGCSSDDEFNYHVANLIPGNYALVVFQDFEPDAYLRRSQLRDIARKPFEEHDLLHVQFVVYNKGMQPGDGVRAYGEIYRNKKIRHDKLIEIETENIAVTGKAAENMLGYTVAPKVLYGFYAEDEFAAAENFRDKPLSLGITVDELLRDAANRPYLLLPLEAAGADETGGTGETGWPGGLRVYFSENDPFLPRLQKGAKIAVRAYATGFSERQVLLEGAVVMCGHEFLVDGAAASRP